MTDDRRPEDQGDLRDHFAELRRLNEGSAPDFDRTWEAARAKSEQREASSKTRRTLLLVGAGLAAAAAIVLIIVPRPGPSSAPPDAPAAMSAISLRPAPPLDFLLVAPAYADLDFDVDPFRYRLDQVLEDANSGVEQ